MITRDHLIELWPKLPPTRDMSESTPKLLTPSDISTIWRSIPIIDIYRYSAIEVDGVTMKITPGVGGGVVTIRWLYAPADIVEAFCRGTIYALGASVSPASESIDTDIEVASTRLSDHTANSGYLEEYTTKRMPEHCVTVKTLIRESPTVPNNRVAEVYSFPTKERRVLASAQDLVCSLQGPREGCNLITRELVPLLL